MESAALLNVGTMKGESGWCVLCLLESGTVLQLLCWSVTINN